MRVFIHDIKEGEGVGQQEQQGDKRDDEERDEVKGEVEEIRSNAHSAQWMTVGRMETQT